MANPNLNSVSNVTCNNSLVALNTTSETLIVSNANASGSVYLIESLLCANEDGTNNADLTLVQYDTSDNSGTGTTLAKTVVVPADATLVVLSKDMAVNLLENQSIYATASDADDLAVSCYWKELA